MLCCFALFACLTLLASFFFPSHLSLKICTCTCMYCICIQQGFEVKKSLFSINKFHSTCSKHVPHILYLHVHVHVRVQASTCTCLCIQFTCMRCQQIPNSFCFMFSSVQFKVEQVLHSNLVPRCPDLGHPSQEA